MRYFLAYDGFIFGVLIVSFFPSAIGRRRLGVVLAVRGVLADPELLVNVGFRAFVNVGLGALLSTVFFGEHVVYLL